MLDDKTPAMTGRLFPGDIHILRLVLSVVSAAAISAIIAVAADAQSITTAIQ